MSITIRTLTSDDVSPFRTLRQEAILTDVFVSYFPDIPHENEAPIDRFMALLCASEKSVFVGAFDAEKLVGYGRLASANMYKVAASEIGSDYVDPPHRRSGVWELLYHEREKLAFQNGMSRLLAHCRTNNLPIQKALQSKGFTISHIVEGRMCNGDVVKGYEMHKDLCLHSERVGMGKRLAPGAGDIVSLPELVMA